MAGGADGANGADDAVVKYFFEAGMLKRMARSGWWAEKVEHPESVAAHSFRVAAISFVLARMEGMGEAGARKLCTAAVFHDMHEARLGDMHKITARYIPPDRALERKVEEEQAQGMEEGVRGSVLGALDLSEKERIILKDADYLECAFQAREYLDAGYSGAATWIGTIGGRLKTASAKRLHARMKDADSNSWWKGLKRLD